MPPKVVGPYRIVDTLGSGGVGTVYRATDRRTGEPVALKLLSTGGALDPRAARRLAREFEALSELSHPNVVKVFDTGVHQGYPYLAMELVEGLTLREYLSLHARLSAGAPVKIALKKPAPPPSVDDSETTGDWDSRPFSLSQMGEESPSEEISAPFSTGPESIRALADAADEPDTLDSTEVLMPYELPTATERAPPPRRAAPPNFVELNQPERVGRLKDAMMQLCQALQYVHGHGLIHRDLKPSNVMVDDDRLVRLMDFGLAKFLADDGAMTGQGRMVGTFRYMAPEQILGEPLDPRADLYSLGIILFELLAGRPPFEANSPQELWHLVLEQEPPYLLTINAHADVQLARVAHRLIRRERDERFQTAEEAYEALAE